MLLGTSQGGGLVLNLASRYNDFDGVVAIAPGHLNFPAGSITANTSAWTFNGKEVPYVPIPFSAVVLSLIGKKSKVWEIIFTAKRSNSEAEIEVEKITCPILLLSAKDDEVWPSQYMCEQIVTRLNKNRHINYYKHISFEGGHYVMRKYFDDVFNFIAEHFK